MSGFPGFVVTVMQRATGAGNNEQQNVVHREAIEARGKLFVAINETRAVGSLLVNKKKPVPNLNVIHARILCHALI